MASETSTTERGCTCGEVMAPWLGTCMQRALEHDGARAHLACERDQQRSSGVLRGPQGSSESSEAIRGNQRSSEVIRGHT